MNICLFASEVAIITGHNKYQDIHEYKAKLWRKHFPNDYQDTLLEYQKLKKVQVLEESRDELINRVCKEQKVSLKKTLDCSNPTEMKKEREKVLKKLEKKLPKTELKEIKDAITEKTNTALGTKTEEKIKKTYNQKNSKNATSDNRFYKMGLRDSDTYSWTLGGRIDGLDKDTGELIEIKNRINRLFYKLRDYEKVQIFIYMKLLDKQEATLIENFKDEMNTILIKWDEKFWQTEVLDKISVFMNEFEQFVQSKEKKMRLLEYLIE